MIFFVDAKKNSNSCFYNNISVTFIEIPYVPQLYYSNVIHNELTNFDC